MNVKAVLFDLGGVYYTEGFRDGLYAIAGEVGVDAAHLYSAGKELVFTTGYITGNAPESEFWKALAKATDTEEDLRRHRQLILESFKLRGGMDYLVQEIRHEVPVGLLTDQTNWLYELQERDNLFLNFDQVISSYEEGFSKRDYEIFRTACQRMDIFPEEGIFFDDNMENVEKAREFGFSAHLFRSPGACRDALLAAGLFKEQG